MRAGKGYFCRVPPACTLAEGVGVRLEEKDKGSQLQRAGQTDGQTDRPMDGRRGPAVYKVSTFCAKMF